MRVEGGIVRRGSRPCLTTHLHALYPLTNTAEMSREFSGHPITIASQNGVYSSMLLRMSSHNKPPRKQSSINHPGNSPVYYFLLAVVHTILATTAPPLSDQIHSLIFTVSKVGTA